MIISCVQWFKDTKLKANHNSVLIIICWFGVVSNGSKILNWKQITTCGILYPLPLGCVQWFKDTKLKANHNYRYFALFLSCVVSNGSKILNWKQITTINPRMGLQFSCVQWFKDTKLKANHNALFSLIIKTPLCPMVQRY